MSSAFEVSPLKIEFPRRDPVYDKADISEYVHKILLDTALGMMWEIHTEYVRYSDLPFEDTSVVYDWDYINRMEERGEMSLEELTALYKNLYTDKGERA